MGFWINNNFVGGKKVFIIAELSANHNQNFDVAVETIKAAKMAGADAIKLQTYTADTITIDCSNEYFKIKQGTIWDGTTLYKLYKQAFTPWEWHQKLKKIANDIGLVCFSSPFDFSAVDFLEKLNMPAYKVASFEINDIPLIEYIAEKKKPVIISTGVAKINEIEEALSACKKKKNNKIALLKCVSSYPALYEDMNLLTINDMAKRFGVIVGISDHTLGINIPISAVSLGAKIVEKHFILDRKLGGPDSQFSINPKEFSEMVVAIRQVEKALGKVTYSLSPKQIKSRDFMRSLFVVKDVKKGEKFSNDNVRSIRPGFGLSPKYIDDIIGKISKNNVKRGTPFSWELIL